MSTVKIFNYIKYATHILTIIGLMCMVEVRIVLFVSTMLSLIFYQEHKRAQMLYSHWQTTWCWKKINRLSANSNISQFTSSKRVNESFTISLIQFVLRLYTIFSLVVSHVDYITIAFVSSMLSLILIIDLILERYRKLEFETSMDFIDSQPPQHL